MRRPASESRQQPKAQNNQAHAEEMSQRERALTALAEDIRWLSHPELRFQGPRHSSLATLHASGAHTYIHSGTHM